MDAESAYVLNLLMAQGFAGLLLVVPLWRIFARAGFSPAWSLLIFLPYAGMVSVLIVLAFFPWPADPMPREVAWPPTRG